MSLCICPVTSGLPAGVRPSVPVPQGLGRTAGLRADSTAPSPEHPAEAAAGKRPREHVRGPVEAAGSRWGGQSGPGAYHLGTYSRGSPAQLWSRRA